MDIAQALVQSLILKQNNNKNPNQTNAKYLKEELVIMI